MKTVERLLKIFLLIALFLVPQTAFADDFKSIDIDVNIDKNGIGNVNEVWKIDERDDDYTERYKEIKNLKGIKIEDFSLNSNGKDFTPLSPWDIDASFDEKAYHYGRIDKGDGVELTWGISDYGDNTYTLHYKINPIIIGLKDYDMLHFRFVGEDFDPEPEHISIRIKGYEPFGKDVSMRGFGFVGDIHNQNGVIVAKSTGDVDYGHIMLRFPKGTFNTSYIENKTFNDYANGAIKGSDRQNQEGKAQKDKIPSRIFFVLIPAFMASIFAMFFGIRYASFGVDDYKILNKKELPKPNSLKDQYYKEVPYEGPLEDVYLPLTNAYKYEIGVNNFINAYLLKRLYEGAINIDKSKNGFFKGKKTSITINNRPLDMSEQETKFFDILVAAEKYETDNNIYEKTISEYMDEHPESTKNYFKDFNKVSLNHLTRRGYIKNDSTDKSFMGKKKTKNEIRYTDEGIDLYKNLIKFRNYLKDYSLIKERDISEVKIWDYYLIYAALYGISEEVYKNLVETYPEFEQYSLFDYYMIHNIYSYSSVVSNSYTSMAGFEAAGAGGSTSFGGGAGGFGGGGGGGR